VSVKGFNKNPALVLLHGFMGTGCDWGHVTDALACDYYCICVDLPGHGMSQNVPLAARSGFRQTHKLLEQTLKRLGVEHYAMLGYSLGGRIAMYHAAQKPKGLRALLLESAHPGLADEQARQERLEHDVRWANRLRIEPITRVLVDWYQQGIFANLTPEQRSEQIRLKAHCAPEPIAKMLEATSLGMQPDLRAKLYALSLPIALINGKRDAKFCNINEQLAPQLAQATWLLFRGAGHNIHFEQPDHFVDRVRDRLTQIYC
jgi:2-succinyl-6-hydroxy-2,4-cyclohexadiene-1-carboxylate synthase